MNIHVFISTSLLLKCFPLCTKFNFSLEQPFFFLGGGGHKFSELGVLRYNELHELTEK